MIICQILCHGEQQRRSLRERERGERGERGGRWRPARRTWSWSLAPSDTGDWQRIGEQQRRSWSKAEAARIVRKRWRRDEGARNYQVCSASPCPRRDAAVLVQPRYE